MYASEGYIVNQQPGGQAARWEVEPKRRTSALHAAQILVAARRLAQRTVHRQCLQTQAWAASRRLLCTESGILCGVSTGVQAVP